MNYEAVVWLAARPISSIFQIGLKPRNNLLKGLLVYRQRVPLGNEVNFINAFGEQPCVLPRSNAIGYGA